MKIEKNSEFQPITITLETREEAKIFYDLLLYCSTKRQGPLKRFADTLSEWFRSANLFMKDN